MTACGAADPERATALVLGLVESVILQRRRAPETIDAETAPGIADAALLVLGATADEVSAAREAGAMLLAEGDENAARTS